MYPARFEFSLATLALTASLGAQRTWIVDAANGPGTDFRDVPAAVTAAADGDTVLVRPHPLPAPYGYRTTTTSKGLSIVGLPGARFTIFNSTPFTVSGLPQGLDFSLQGFAFLQSSGIAALSFQNCLGRIHLDRLDLTAVATATQNAPGVLMASSHLTMNECTVSGAPALHLATTGTSISLSRCTLSGSGPTPFPAISTAAGGLSTPPWSLAIDSCHITGGLAGSTGAAAITTGGVLPSAGLLMSLKVYGNSVIEAPAGAVSPVSAMQINGYGSISVLLSTEAALVPRNGAPAVNGNATVTTVRLPSLQTGGVAPGGVIHSVLRSPVNDLVILAVGAPFDRIITPPFGELWLDALGIYFITAGFQDTTENWMIDIQIPSSAPRGLPLTLQGLSGPGLDVRLTNPVVVVLN